MIILGAGLSGCIAAYKFPNAKILEKQELESINSHGAVLRFRTNAISDITGIPFKKVTVRKSIYHNGKLIQKPNIRLCNFYSKKLTNVIIDRSIWNLDTVERYIAPRNFHRILLDSLCNRIEFNQEFSGMTSATSPIISTIPMGAMSKIIGLDIGEDLEFKKIFTTRYKVKISNVHQTIYFPHPELNIYRATLTGSDLIVESLAESSRTENILVYDALGISSEDCILIDDNAQRFGKIKPINEVARKNFIHKISFNHGIFSLGRFAIWKNIILDDVLEDINMIRKIISEAKYDESKHGIFKNEC